MKLPERWLEYSKSVRINNTPFVACKVPLREGFSTKLDSRTSFTPNDLLRAHPQIDMVVDLTQTSKYYNGREEFIKKGIKYLKIKTRGNGVLPFDWQFKLFVKEVNEFLSSTFNKGCLVAVHCTHGINRTGYFIIRFMIEELGYGSETALKQFMLCRGHVMERENLIDDLLIRGSKKNKQPVADNNF